MASGTVHMERRNPGVWEAGSEWLVNWEGREEPAKGLCGPTHYRTAASLVCYLFLPVFLRRTGSEHDSAWKHDPSSPSTDPLATTTLRPTPLEFTQS